MLFMIVEEFREGARAAVYERLAQRGRMIPEGVHYLNSWVEESGRRCFQLMDCADASQLEPWIAAWTDLVDFEVVPVVTSEEAARRAAATAGD